MAMSQGWPRGGFLGTWGFRLGMAALAPWLATHVALAAGAGTQEALLAAIKADDLAATRAAVERGADLNAAGPFQRTPLHEAAKGARPPLIEWMLAHGTKPHARDGDGRDPLHLANSVSAEVLLRHNADARLVDRQGNTALHVAAEGDREMCRLLVKAGVPVDVRNQSGLTPLHFAALEGNQAIAAYLIEQGADVNAKTRSNYLHKWSTIAWDVKGMEKEVPAGETPHSIARRLHKENRWVRGRIYDDLAEFFLSKGAVERKWWRFWE